MIKKRILILTTLIISLLILTLVEENKWFSFNPKVKFQRVGYFESEGNKVFVFYVSDTAWAEIEKHGRSLDHAEGNITAAFYYLRNSYAPDLSLAKNFYNAIDKAQTHDCIAAAWQNHGYDLKKYPSKTQTLK